MSSKCPNYTVVIRVEGTDDILYFNQALWLKRVQNLIERTEFLIRKSSHTVTVLNAKT